MKRNRDAATHKPMYKDCRLCSLALVLPGDRRAVAEAPSLRWLSKAGRPNRPCWSPNLEEQHSRRVFGLS